MGQYKSQYTGPQIDAGVGAALNPDLVPTESSDALITSDAVAKVQHGFAPIETAATSTNSYAIGDLLVWGGVLYKAKTSITVGDSFVVDTNIEATTIADKLNNIDTEITSDTDTTLTGLLTGNGSKVGTKSLDTSSLTNDADHVPVSSVVKSALDNKADQTDLASIRATGSTNTTGATIKARKYFYLDNVLVRAKTDIAVNATFTSGTNYETVTAGGLNDLMSAIGDKTYYDITLNTGLIDPQNANNAYNVCVANGICYLNIAFLDLSVLSISSDSWTLLGTIPVGARPTNKSISCFGAVTDGGRPVEVLRVVIQTDGQIFIKSRSTVNADALGAISVAYVL